jgi:DNA-binding LytR/AlgR family response regulator
MLKAIIVEDEENGRKYLENLLTDLYPRIQVVGTADNVTKGVEIIRALKPDVVFLDIQMNTETGFDLLERIGNIDFEVGETNGGLSIISTTNNTNEIVQGLFELKFLLIFTKCTNLCNQVTLFLKNDYPIILTYQIASLGEIKLVLSPSKSD